MSNGLSLWKPLKTSSISPTKMWTHNVQQLWGQLSNLRNWHPIPGSSSQSTMYNKFLGLYNRYYIKRSAQKHDLHNINISWHDQSQKYQLWEYSISFQCQWLQGWLRDSYRLPEPSFPFRTLPLESGRSCLIRELHNQLRISINKA